MHKIYLSLLFIFTTSAMAQSFNFYIPKGTKCSGNDSQYLSKNYYFEIDRSKLDLRNAIGIKRDTPLLDQDISIDIAGLNCQLKTDTQSRVMIQVPSNTLIERLVPYSGETDYILSNDTEFLTLSHHLQDGQLINYPIPLLKSGGPHRGEQFAWLNERDAKSLKRQKDQYMPERINYDETLSNEISTTEEFKSRESLTREETSRESTTREQ